MPPKPHRTHLFKNFSTASFLVVAVPVMAVIAISIYLGIAALFLNIKFARCTDQVLSLVSVVRDASAKDPTLGQLSNEDLVDDLSRRGMIDGQPHNPWGGDVRMNALPLPVLRLQTELPPLICKRLSIYLGKNARALKLQKLEAKVDNGNWTTIFDQAYPDLVPSATAIPACGHGPRAVLAAVVSLR